MGNTQSGTKVIVNLEGVFEHTVFDEEEVHRITKLYGENGIDGILNLLVPMPILPIILSWLREQGQKEGISDEVTIEQIVYLLDTLHPRQSLDNKRDLAWKVYDGDEDGRITHPDLLAVFGHILPGVQTTTHQVLTERTLAQFPNKVVNKEDFPLILSDERLFDLFTRSIS